MSNIPKREWILVWASGSVGALASNYAKDFSSFTIESALKLMPSALIVVGVLTLILIGILKLFNIT